jgi:hypothetical protein
VARLAVYESKNVIITFAGLSLTDGRAENFFKITGNPAYKMEGPGADGHVARCGTNDDTYKISLTFKGSSNAHAKLSTIHLADRAASNGAGIAPLFIKDGNGSTLIVTDRAWIVGLPEKGLGVTPADVEWQFEAIIPPGGYFCGGN